MLTLAAFIFVIGVLITIHEAGHFVVARLLGAPVEVFSIGFGKRLWGFERGGTDYRISVFPVGGFCKMKGERSYAQAIDEKLDEIPKEPGSFFAARPWRRIIAMLAGPIANIILAIVILWFFPGLATWLPEVLFG